MLAGETNLTPLQVVNWTTNIRKRNMKATVEKEKKPHHFLDYLFLATDREKRMREVHPTMDMSRYDNLYGTTITGQPMAPNAINCLGLDRQNMMPWQPLLLGFVPPVRNHQVQQQPTPNPRISSPRVIERSESNQIFRRGKGQGHKKAQLLAKLEAKERAKERERFLLQECAPRGIDHTPAGCFDEDYDRPGMDDVIDERIFDQIKSEIDFHSISDGSFFNHEQPNVVSFEGLCDVPYVESVDDYFLSL